MSSISTLIEASSSAAVLLGFFIVVPRRRYAPGFGNPKSNDAARPSNLNNSLMAPFDPGIFLRTVFARGLLMRGLIVLRSRRVTFHQSYAMVFAFCMCAGAPSKTGRGAPTPCPDSGGPAPTRGSRPLAGQTHPNNAQDPDGLDRLSRAECLARREVRVSAPETRAGRMATSARITLGQESIANDAESYQRDP